MALVCGWLGLTLLAALPDLPARAPNVAGAYVPLLSQEEAWDTLPTLEHGTKNRLPLWALATAKAMLRTTAAVLELEQLHRAKSPLEAKLRGQIRLVVAHANTCGYTEA